MMNTMTKKIKFDKYCTIPKEAGMKKTLTLILAALLILTPLTACSESPIRTLPQKPQVPSQRPTRPLNPT